MFRSSDFRVVPDGKNVIFYGPYTLPLRHHDDAPDVIRTRDLLLTKEAH